MDAKELATTPSAQNKEDPSYLDPEAKPKIKSIENTAPLLEDRMVEALLSILDNGNDRDKLKAVNETAEILGKKQKAVQIQTPQLNMQNNQFLQHFQQQALTRKEDRPINANFTDMSTSDSQDEVDTQ